MIHGVTKSRTQLRNFHFTLKKNLFLFEKKFFSVLKTEQKKIKRENTRILGSLRMWVSQFVFYCFLCFLFSFFNFCKLIQGPSRGPRCIDLGETGGKGKRHNYWKSIIARGPNLNWLEPNECVQDGRQGNLTSFWSLVYTQCNTWVL